MWGGDWMGATHNDAGVIRIMFARKRTMSSLGILSVMRELSSRTEARFSMCKGYYLPSNGQLLF